MEFYLATLLLFQAAVLTTEAVEHFTVSFTVTNLIFREEMRILTSRVFNSSNKTFSLLLDKNFAKTSIGPAFLGCRVTGLRPASGKYTGIDATCAYKKDATTFDRSKIYRELVTLTKGFTEMRPYSLDRYSFYINAVLPTTTEVTAQFSLNFIVNNLEYKEEMANPDSKGFVSTDIIFTFLLKPIVSTSHIGSVFVGCKVKTLRPGRNEEETKMDAICIYKDDPTAPSFDRVKMYQEIKSQTNGFTMMGPYSLERYSLHVNGYNETPEKETLLPIEAVEHFTVSFTVTDLIFREELDKNIAKTSIGPAFLGCRVKGLRPASGKYTSIDATCAYKKDATTFDHSKMYRELFTLTKGFTEMGPYSLDRYSFYINGLQTISN